MGNNAFMAGSFGGGGGSYGTLSTDIAERKAGMVRATQAYLWSQTQAPGAVGGGGAKGGGEAASTRVVPGRATGGTGVAVARPHHQAFPSQTQSKMLAPRASGTYCRLLFSICPMLGNANLHRRRMSLPCCYPSRRYKYAESKNALEKARMIPNRVRFVRFPWSVRSVILVISAFLLLRII